MGYTHYWRFYDYLDKEEKQNIVNDVQQLLDNVDIPLTLDGRAHTTPIVSPRHICFNGDSDNHYETFYVDLENPVYWDFCKTGWDYHNRKPYDSVVVQVLNIIKHHIDIKIMIESDAFDEEKRAEKFDTIR